MSNIMQSCSLSAKTALNQRSTYNSIKCWWVDISDVVKEVAIGTEFADDHDRSVLRVGRNAHTKLWKQHENQQRMDVKKGTYEADNVGVIKITQQLEFLNVHCGCKVINGHAEKKAKALTCAQLAAELRDRDLPTLELADENILEATAANLLELGKFLRWDLTVIQAEAFEVELQFRLRLFVVAGQWRCAGFVQMYSLRALENRRRVSFCTTSLPSTGS